MTGVSDDDESLSAHGERSRSRSLLKRGWAALGTDGRDAFGKLVSMISITVVTQLMALASLYLVVKALTVSEFGVLSSALAVQGFGTILSTLGIRPILVRELSRCPERRNELCSAYVVFALCGGALVAGIVFAVLAVLKLQAAETFVFQIVAIGTILAAINPAPIYDADGKQVVSTALTFLAELLSLMLVICLWVNNSLGVIDVACVFAGKWFAMSAFGWGYLFMRSRGFRWHLDRQNLRPLLCSSTPLSAAAMLQTAMISSGPLLARTLGGQTAAGIYGLAHQALVAHMLTMSLAGRIVAPKIAVRYQDSGFMIRAGNAYVGFAFCLSVAGVVSGLVVLHTFLDPAYHAAKLLIVILMSAAFVRSVYEFSNLIHIARHREELLLSLELTAFLSFGGLVAILLRTFQAEIPSTIPVALTVSLSLSAFISLFRHRK